MNTQKSVFNKISKLTPKEVELSEVEKVEFSVAEEMKKAQDAALEMQRIARNYQEAYDNAISQINKIKQDLDISKGERPLAEGLRYKKEFEKAALTRNGIYENLKLYSEILEGTMRAVFDIERKIKAIG